MNYENRKLLDLARDQPCAHCGRNDGTVVAAHSNQSIHGKGARLKAHDCFIAFLCVRCHSWLDQGANAKDPLGIYYATREDKAEMFNRAMFNTMRYMWEKDLIEVKR